MIGTLAAAVPGLLMVLLFSGCATISEPPAAPHRETIMLPAARVVRINREHKYFIMNCVARPQAGMEVAVYRAGQRRGLAEITEIRGNLAAAELITGDAIIGDLVYFPRRQLTP